MALVLNVLDMKLASALNSVGDHRHHQRPVMPLMAQPRIFFAIPGTGSAGRNVEGAPALSHAGYHHDRDRARGGCGCGAPCRSTSRPSSARTDALCVRHRLCRRHRLRFTRRDIHRPFRVPCSRLCRHRDLVVWWLLVRLHYPLDTLRRLVGARVDHLPIIHRYSLATGRVASVN